MKLDHAPQPKQQPQTTLPSKHNLNLNRMEVVVYSSQNNNK